MRNLLGVLLIIAGACLGLYVGIGIFVISGVHDIIDGVKANPSNAGQVVWGILKVTPLAELFGGLVFFLCAAPGAALLGRKRRGFRL